MDARSSDLQARLATIGGFGDLVSAMRGVAASRAQRARRLSVGVEAYADVVSQAMAQALSLFPADQRPPADPAHSGGPPLWLVFAAEQGFNGGFSERVLDALPEKDEPRLLLLGAQGLRLAHARGLKPEWSGPLIAHAEAVVVASEALRLTLVEALTRQSASRVDLVFAHLLPGSQFECVVRQLLPLDLPALHIEQRTPPQINLPPGQLLDDLSVEYVSAQLALAMLHSHAAENLSRLHAMAAAHENVERMSEALHAEQRRQRQEEITEEIVELAGGLRSLKRKQESAGKAL